MLFRIALLGQVVLGCLVVPLSFAGHGYHLGGFGRADSDSSNPPLQHRARSEHLTLHCLERQRQEDEPAVQEAIKYLNGIGVRPLVYSSKEEFVGQVLATLGESRCLKELNLYGHGHAGFFSMGNGQSTANRESTFIANRMRGNDWRRAFLGLRAKFCDGATLNILGCNVGSGEEGAALVFALAKYFGVKVRAPVNLFVGVWETVKHSGTIPATHKRVLMDRVNKLIQAVSEALVQANSVEAPQPKVGREIMQFLFAAPAA